MNNQDRTINNPETALSKFYNHISSRSKLAFFSGVILCLITHIFAYTNTLFVHDSLAIYNTSDGIANGRWFIPILFKFIDNVQVPWIIGLLTSVILGMASVVIVKTLNIRNKLFVILTSGLIVTSPVITSSHCYFSSTYIYATALLLSCLAAYYVDKGKCGWLISTALLCISLGCYQAYISTAAVLMLLVLIRKLLALDSDVNKVFVHAMKSLVVLIIGTLIYYCIWQGLVLITGVPISDYRGESAVGFSLLSHLPSSVLTTYIDAALVYMSPSLRSFLPLIGYLCEICVLIVTVVVFFRLLYGKYAIKLSRTAKALLFFFLFLLPLAAGLIIIFHSSIPPHWLMRFAIITPWFLMFVSVEAEADRPTNFIKHLHSRNAIIWICVALSVLSIYSNILVANKTYLKLKMDYDSALSLCTRIVDRIENVDGFTSDTQVVYIVEDEWVLPYTEQRSWTLSLRMLTGASGRQAVTYDDTLSIFINDELGVGMNLTMDNGTYAVMDSVQQMSGFPTKNCTLWVDGVLVIKISMNNEYKASHPNS